MVSVVVEAPERENLYWRGKSPYLSGFPMMQS
jgi:hypothetical protein